MGLQALRRIQLGKETTYGVSVPATAKMIAMASLHEVPTFGRPVDERGLFQQQVRSYQQSQDAALHLKGDLTFEQIMYLLAMSVKGGVAGATTTGVTTWSYGAATNAAQAVDSYTVEYGDDTQEFKATSAFVTDLSISGAVGGLVTYDATLHAQDVASGTFTGSLTDPAVENPVVANGKLFIDNAWSGLGGTLFSNTLIDYQFKFTTGRKPKHFVSGSLLSQGIAEGLTKAEIDLTFEFNGTANTEKANWKSQVPRFVRLQLLGTNIPSGVPTTAKTINIDLAVYWDDWSEFGARDGVNTIKVKATSFYDATGANELLFTVKNGVATLA